MPDPSDEVIRFGRPPRWRDYALLFALALTAGLWLAAWDDRTAEVEAWLARDPLKLYEAALVKRKVLTRAAAEELIAAERARQRAASERAAAAPWPEVGRIDYETLTFA